MEELDVEYDASRAPIWLIFMQRLSDTVGEQGYAFAQQYILEKGLKIFGKRG